MEPFEALNKVNRHSGINLWRIIFRSVFESVLAVLLWNGCYIITKKENSKNVYLVKFISDKISFYVFQESLDVILIQSIQLCYSVLIYAPLLQFFIQVYLILAVLIQNCALENRFTKWMKTKIIQIAVLEMRNYCTYSNYDMKINCIYLQSVTIRFFTTLLFRFF